MPILNSTTDIKQHIAVLNSFVFADIQPYISDAIYQFTEKWVGDLHIFLEDETPADQTNAAVKNKARYFLQKAVANFAMYIYVPVGSVNIDSSGISVSKTENRDTVAWQQANDLQRRFLENGHTAMDLLLSHLEKNKTVFPDWAADFYTVKNELLVNGTDVFQSAYNIFNSRQTYLALLPSIRQVEDQYIFTAFLPELIQHLKNETLTGAKAALKTLLQKAVVSYTVAKVCAEGLFILSADGLKLPFNTLPNDRMQPIDSGKGAQFVDRTAASLQKNGDNYIEMALKVITDNPADFADFEVPVKVNVPPTRLGLTDNSAVFGL